MSFRVVTPATDRALLSIEEARAAAGVTGSSQDDALGKLVLAVSDLITRECGVVASGSQPPSLRSEACEEEFRRPRRSTIVLSRRFVSDLVVIEDGATLDVEAFELDELAGLVTRLSGTCERSWGARVLATYKAGFDVVPADLKRAATAALREFSASDSRDPLLRSETVDGVGRFDFQIGGSGRDDGETLPVSCLGALGPYTTLSVG